MGISTTSPMSGFSSRVLENNHSVGFDMNNDLEILSSYQDNVYISSAVEELQVAKFYDAAKGNNLKICFCFRPAEF